MTKTDPEDGMIIFDHDIGANPDDFFALILLAVKCPERLLCAVSGNMHERARAQAAEHILDLLGFLHVRSFCGKSGGVTDIFDSYLTEGAPEPQGFEEFLNFVVASPSRKLSWLGIQGAANVRAALENEKIENRLYDLTHFGLSTKNLKNEWNTDGGTNWNAAPKEAGETYQLFKHSKVVGLQTTLRDDLRVTPDSELGKRLLQSETPIAELLWKHCVDFHKRRNLWPAMHDPIAATVILGERFVTFENRTFDFSPEGYRPGSAVAVQVSRPSIDARGFMDYLTRAISEIL